VFGGGRLGILIPLESQRPSAAQRRPVTLDPLIAVASPYGDPEALVRAARDLARSGATLVVMAAWLHPGHEDARPRRGGRARAPAREPPRQVRGRGAVSADFPFPVVTIAGPPRERGRQYGQLARDRIATSLQIYTAAWGGGEAPARSALLDRARAFMAVIGERFSDLMEEVWGIAEGAERPVEEIVALNARTELLYGQAAADGCTGAVLLPGVAGGHTIIGQNWDWRPACRASAILLRVIPERGPRLLTFVEAGMLARSGMNSAGIGLCGNFLQSDHDPDWSPSCSYAEPSLSQTPSGRRPRVAPRALLFPTTSSPVRRRGDSPECSPRVFRSFPRRGYSTREHFVAAGHYWLRRIGQPVRERRSRFPAGRSSRFTVGDSRWRCATTSACRLRSGRRRAARVARESRWPGGDGPRRPAGARPVRHEYRSSACLTRRDLGVAASSRPHDPSTPSRSRAEVLQAAPFWWPSASPCSRH
jgi:hypothetical protein